MNAAPVNYDVLTGLQDDLMTRLLAGRVTRTNLRRTYEVHVSNLVAAGFPERESQTLFWDAVAAAKTQREDLP